MIMFDGFLMFDYSFYYGNNFYNREKPIVELKLNPNLDKERSKNSTSDEIFNSSRLTSSIDLTFKKTNLIILFPC